MLLLLLLLPPMHVYFSAWSHSQCMLEATDTSGLQFMPLQKLLQNRKQGSRQTRQATESTCRRQHTYLSVSDRTRRN
jgi:hypothetical protein